MTRPGRAASERFFDGPARMLVTDRQAARPPRTPPGGPPAPARRLRVHPAAATRRASALAVAALLGTVPAAWSHAQEAPAPACAAATAGQLSSQAGVRCACRFLPESALAATPAGYRWDCGILRARLDELPVDLSFYPYPLPDALSIERGFVPDLPPTWPRPRR